MDVILRMWNSSTCLSALALRNARNPNSTIFDLNKERGERFGMDCALKADRMSSQLATNTRRVGNTILWNYPKIVSLLSIKFAEA